MKRIRLFYGITKYLEKLQEEIDESIDEAVKEDPSIDVIDYKVSYAQCAYATPGEGGWDYDGIIVGVIYTHRDEPKQD